VVESASPIVQNNFISGANGFCLVQIKFPQ
jgi:hypothetical protein